MSVSPLERCVFFHNINGLNYYIHQNKNIMENPAAKGYRRFSSTTPIRNTLRDTAHSLSVVPHSKKNRVLTKRKNSVEIEFTF